MKKLTLMIASLGLIWTSPLMAQDSDTQYDSYDETSSTDEVTRVVEEGTITEDTSTNENVGEITSSGVADMESPQKSEKYNFFRFGPASAMNLEATGAGIYLSGGQLYSTHPQAAIRIAAETVFANAETSGTSSFFSASLGGVYYIDESDTAPHAFADLGYGYADGPEVDATNGFTLGAGVGTAFFRTTDMQMDVSARYQILMSPNDKGTPSILALMLGLNFG